MNKAILIGRVGKDPETKSFDNGNTVSNFSLATSKRFKNKSGELEDKTEWHNIQAWNNSFVENYVNKGDLVAIEGEIQTRSWETDSGEKRYTTEISVLRIDGLSSKADKQKATEGGNGQEPDNLPF